MKSLRRSRGKQLGISLVEMSIGAVVTSALLVAVLFGIPKLRLDQQLNQARQEVPLVITTMMTTYAPQPNTSGASTQILSSANAWPNARVTDLGLATVAVKGVFPGSTERVFANESVGWRLTGKSQGFAYWLHNVPKQACLPLVQLLTSQRGVVEVSVGDATLTPSGARATSVVSGLSLSQLTTNMASATAACSAAGNKSVVALVSRA